VLLGLERQAQVRAIEAADEYARRRREELVDDVAARRCVGRRRERHGLQPAADLPRHCAQGEVLRPEIMAPLRDAVRLVDHHHADVGLRQHLDRVGPADPLGCKVEKPQFATAQQIAHARVLGRVVARVEAARCHAGRGERAHLVAHEGDQRRHDQRQAVADDRRELIAQ
jgi:hypothetical protein